MTSAKYIMWNERFSVEDSGLDSEHKVIFQLLNELYDALQTGHSGRPVRVIIEDACDYANRHFAHEEAILLKVGYSGFAKHVEQHRQYSKEVERIRMRANTSFEDMAFELFQFLKEWWLNHVTQVDQAYASCLKQH